MDGLFSLFKGSLFNRGDDDSGGDPPTYAKGHLEKGQEGPCLRCGEWSQALNSSLFCQRCWVMACDLSRWAGEKQLEARKAKARAAGLDPDSVEIEVDVRDWAYILAAHFPRDPGPDPKNPTWPSTWVKKGSYWQPDGNRNGLGICLCHSYMWN